MTPTDLDLLRDYAEKRSEPAFAALVQRHLNLVYSAALRQVRSPQLAEEVAQSVFADLARNADKLKPGTILTAWLYEVARRTAIDVIRREARRQLREQIATEMNAANATASDWTHIEPLLDDAMHALDATDRAAILLRYFENKSLREVGVTLGTSDDAAQKRVTRAVERLREYFAKHGVTTGAAGLVVILAANAVQAAPVGLAVTISTAAVLAGTTLTTTATATAVKTIAMSTLQKTLIAITLATTVGLGVYEAKEAAKARAEVQTLQGQQAPLTEENRQLLRERDDATSRLAGLLAENARIRSNPNQNELFKLRGEVTQLKAVENDPANKAGKEWLDKVNRLKQRLEENPGAKIPEFQFLTDQDWLNAANGKLDTETDYRKAFALLRNTAENKFGSIVQSALQKYYQANGTQFPADFAQLQPYFDSSVDDSVLQRWQIISSQTAPNLGLGDPIITQKAAVDDLFDSRIAIGPRGYGSSDFLSSEIKITLGPVFQAYMAANNGQEPTSQSQLLPFASTAEQKILLQKIMQRDSLMK